MKRHVSSQDDAQSDFEIPMFEDQPRASSISSKASDHVSVSSSSPPPNRPSTLAPPAKKRRLSPPAAAACSNVSSTYLGSFLVGDAWSTVTGKGYVKINDEIRVQRDDQDDSKVGFRNPPRKTDNGKKKQMSITTMWSTKSAKSSKKKVDSIVRLTNARGFGMMLSFSIRDRS
jgi:DNA repair protein RAD5